MADEASSDDFPRRLLAATTGSGDRLKELVFDRSEEVVRALVANPNLAEEDLLVLLERRDLPVDVFRRVASDVRRSASYRVRLALLRNPRTPASAVLRFIPQLHLFDLVSISFLPFLPREVRAAAEGIQLTKLKEMPLGMRVTLARRTPSPAVLAQLIADRQRSVVEATMSNPRLTEETVLRGLRGALTAPHTIDIVSRSERWSARYDIRYALLRSPLLPLARALHFLGTIRAEDRALLAEDPLVPEQLRDYLGKLSRR